MDVRGLILVPSVIDTGEGPLPLSALPLPVLEVAGRSPLERMVEGMRQSGIESVTAVVDCQVLPELHNTSLARDLECQLATRDRFWRIAENVFNDMAQNGAELVIVAHMGGYVEIDFDRVTQFHLDRHSRVTRVCQDGQPAGIFCISASRRNDAASLFRSQLTSCRSECIDLEHEGYFNPLQAPRDLRQLAIDILTLKTRSGPAGKQIKPGVWVERGAVIEKGARVLAPAFIGEYARVRTHAVVTRCSAIEHHAQIDCGTVTENSSVLPYCYVGAGLDLAHSVAGAGRIAHLSRNVSVEIFDSKLVGSASPSSLRGVVRAAADLVIFIPRQMWRGVVGKPQPQQRDLKTALHQTSPALGSAAGYQAPACDSDAAGEFPNLAIVRKYGHGHQ